MNIFVVNLLEMIKLALKNLVFITSLLIIACTTIHHIDKPTVVTLSISDLRKRYSSGDYSQWPKPNLDKSVKEKFVDIGHLPEMKYPEDNPYSKEKQHLGKLLFFDRRLSQTQQHACASCHNSELGWTDNTTRSFGHDRQIGARNAMTILNSGYASELFWDGRAKSLEDQALMPIQDPVEMNLHIDIAVDRIQQIEGYKPLFKEAFGDQTITKKRIAQAIATFERGIVSGTTPFDRFIDGNQDAMTDQQVEGMHLFRTKARCINCHNSGYFSDNTFRNDGTSLIGKEKHQDLGRYTVTKDFADLGKFRVPSLRETMRTQPWMHNGGFTPFKDVIIFYNLGNGHPALEEKSFIVIDGKKHYATKDPILGPLNLTPEEIDAVESFLHTLSSKPIRISPPTLP